MLEPLHWKRSASCSSERRLDLTPEMRLALDEVWREIALGDLKPHQQESFAESKARVSRIDLDKSPAGKQPLPHSLSPALPIPQEVLRPLICTLCVLIFLISGVTVLFAAGGVRLDDLDKVASVSGGVFGIAALVWTIVHTVTNRRR